MSANTTSHAYGIGVITVIVGLSVGLIFYTGFYLPESLAKPSVSEHILEPSGILEIEIPMGAVIEGNPSYVPNKAVSTLEIDNRVNWTNYDDTPHTVTPDHRTSDSYSGDFGSPGVIKSGESYEFLFTEPQEILYHCEPHPWMKGSIKIEKSRF
ncbi:MAG: plastocyanin/azurin family copper-binding protein [Nitrosopumilus sp.]|nr:plastocyanin/azurin family copper-binding protein [Nitrosopumilus sp.]MDH3385242.1 plastocyanin/azurin family copper-binding protein [Nitrosopumilus sp.]